jgi:hypothetical protein
MRFLAFILWLGISSTTFADYDVYINDTYLNYNANSNIFFTMSSDSSDNFTAKDIAEHACVAHFNQFENLICDGTCQAGPTNCRPVNYYKYLDDQIRPDPIIQVQFAYTNSSGQDMTFSQLWATVKANCSNLNPIDVTTITSNFAILIQPQGHTLSINGCEYKLQSDSFQGYITTAQDLLNAGCSIETSYINSSQLSSCTSDLRTYYIQRYYPTGETSDFDLGWQLAEYLYSDPPTETADVTPNETFDDQDGVTNPYTQPDQNEPETFDPITENEDIEQTETLNGYLSSLPGGSNSIDLVVDPVTGDFSVINGTLPSGETGTTNDPLTNSTGGTGGGTGGETAGSDSVNVTVNNNFNDSNIVNELSQINEFFNNGSDTLPDAETDINGSAQVTAINDLITDIGTGDYQPFGSGWSSGLPSIQGNGTCPDFDLTVGGHHLDLSNPTSCEFIDLVTVSMDFMFFFFTMLFVFHEWRSIVGGI